MSDKRTFGSRPPKFEIREVVSEEPITVLEDFTTVTLKKPFVIDGVTHASGDTVAVKSNIVNWLRQNSLV